MPDTGAPWNIPYADPTDLVRDWPDLSEDIADAVALGLTNAGNPGIGSNVVQTVKTNVFTTTSATFTNVTGVSVTITPTSNTSRVLLLCYTTFSGSGVDGTGSHLRLNGGNLNFVGNAAGTRVQAAATTGVNFAGQYNLFTAHFSANITVVDSPATTSATTYTLQGRIGTGGSLQINRGGSDSDNANNARTVTSIIAIEVAP